MKEVSLREFQLRAGDYLGELPIVLTRYNKPIAIVNTFSKDVSESVDTKEVEVEESVDTFRDDYETGEKCELCRKREAKRGVWADGEQHPVCEECALRHKVKGLVEIGSD